MYWQLILLFLFYTTPARAQFGALHTVIKEMALQNPQGVPGDLVSGDLKNAIDEENDPECKTKKEEKSLELVFVGQVNPTSTIKVGESIVKDPEIFRPMESRTEYQNLKDKTTAELLELVKSKRPDEDPVPLMGSLLILGASQMYDPKKANDVEYNKSVMNWAGNHIKSLGLTREQQIGLIASMSSSLYENYNDPRNVTKDSDNDPRFFATQARGVIKNERNLGGVCDDIAYFGCELYQNINPVEDCLTMHTPGLGGTQHFVMLLGNKGTRSYTTIDGSVVGNVEGGNYLSMDAGDAKGTDFGMNIRLNRVHEGKHQSIALVKNEYGQFMERVMDQEGKPGSSLVKNLDGALLQQMGLALEKKKKSYEEEQKKTKLGVDQGQLNSGARVIAVYLLKDKTTPGKKVDIHSGYGLSYSYTRFSPRERNVTFESRYSTSDQPYTITLNDKGQTDVHRVHFNPYVGFGKSYDIQKGDHKFQIHYLNGAYANVLAGAGSVDFSRETSWKRVDSKGNTLYESSESRQEKMISPVVDGNLGLTQRVGVNYSNDKTGTNASLTAQASQQLGADWNRSHGLVSDPLKSLKHLTFFLNRVEVDAQVSQKVSDNKTLFGGAQYLGTSVGQNALVQLGLKVDIPEGMKVYVLTGYGTEMGGFKTKQNYLPVSNNSGATLKAGVLNNRGLNVEAGVRYDPKSLQNKVMPQATATIPLNKPKRKPAKTTK